MLIFNCEREMLSEPEFRRALTYALDIPAIIDLVMLGYALPGLPGFFADYMPGALTDLEYEYNADIANAMLDELGYSQRSGNGIRLSGGRPISFELLVQANLVARIRAAELIKEYFEAVGIGVTVTAMEFDTVRNRVWPEMDVAEGRDFDMSMWGWSAPITLNPASLVRLGMSDHLLGNLNISGLVSAEFDELSRMYLNTSGAADQTEISKDLQRLLMELAPFVNLWYDNMNYAVNMNDYDGWVVQTGVGIINRHSFLP
jgi:peptide/nickel transport system substrate-binding protein